MKLVAKDGMKLSRRNNPFARNAGSSHGAAKENRIHRIREKSADRTSTRGNQSASWHKDVETLLHSVETAYAAAERMRLALEDHDTETREPDEEPLDDVF